MSGARTQFPPAALEWLVGRSPVRVVTLTNSPALPRLLAAAGHEVLAIAEDAATARRIAASAGVTTVIGRAESLPLAACMVDVVIVHQSLQKFAPGLAFHEFARVLAPDGHVANAYLSRDDSVPWVRRLVELMQSIDPEAMRGEFGDEAIKNLRASKLFPASDGREFRVWVPISSAELVAMIEAQPFMADLDADRRADLLAKAAELYAAAGAGQSLRLPYQLCCAKAYVDHAEFTTPIRLTDDALIIPL